MKITAITKGDDVASFAIADTSASYMNSLRRAVISLVPTLAVETVEVFENSSALYDEVLAHRLGLLPLTTDLSSYKLTEITDDVFRPESQVKLTLEAKGPKIVCAEELVSADPSVKCPYPKMQIVKLLEGQEVKLSMVAQLGQGKTHMKWAGANAYYQHAPYLVSGKTEKDVAKEALATKSKELIDDSIVRKDNEFVFTIESWGQMPAKDLLFEAIKQLDAQLDLVAEALK